MTFSIVAKDLRTGAFGVATATGGPVVGSLVPHARVWPSSACPLCFVVLPDNANMISGRDQMCTSRRTVQLNVPTIADSSTMLYRTGE